MSRIGSKPIEVPENVNFLKDNEGEVEVLGYEGQGDGLHDPCGTACQGYEGQVNEGQG